MAENTFFLKFHLSFHPWSTLKKQNGGDNGQQKSADEN